MSASIYFNKIFTKKNLKNIYYTNIRYNISPGIDRINKYSFEKNLSQNIEIIYRKVRNGTYNFSQYREKLLLRGPQKTPRVISITTIRDKLTQKALLEVLLSVYSSGMPFLHKIINEVASIIKSGAYDSFLRLDVSNFYPSINHDLLLKEIRKKIRKTELLHIIENAICQATVTQPEGKNRNKNAIGVPQGLSISNLLANVYMMPIDHKHLMVSSYKYFRYVDDILILCSSKDIDIILDVITKDCDKLGLIFHDKDEESSKSSSGKISDGLTYLGYFFKDSQISVRKKSVDNLRESIINSFTNYKYSKSHIVKLLKWNIDLRITGCVFNKTKYGWLFFFSQIGDLALLKSLDHFVNKQFKIFNLDPKLIKPKRFMRSFHEITRNLKRTSYIPNFDKMSIVDKRKLLSNIFGLNTQKMTEAYINYHFNKRIYRTVKQLERDLVRPS